MDAAMTYLPEPVAELATVLAGMPGAVAVALGGSRALGVGDADSDWDFGLYTTAGSTWRRSPLGGRFTRRGRLDAC